MRNKIIRATIAVVLALAVFSSCKETETYAEQRDREISAINSFIAKRGIKVISETDFKAKGEVTDVESNEYVYLESTGIYMQIVSQGHGEKIGDGKGMTVICRFEEYNINGDSVQISNLYSYTAFDDDVMTVTRNSGTYTASFSSGLMLSFTSSKQVPAGWLVPLPYISIGRPGPQDDAHVRLIVPHSQGHGRASNNVYACHYDLYYTSGEPKTD